MAVNVTIFDPTTQRNNTINVNMAASLIQGDEDPNLDYYIYITTSAKRGPTGADSIPSEIVRDMADLALDTRQFKIDTANPYDDITASVEDYVLKMVEGVNPGEEMYFRP